MFIRFLEDIINFYFLIRLKKQYTGTFQNEEQKLFITKNVMSLKSILDGRTHTDGRMDKLSFISCV